MTGLPHYISTRAFDAAAGTAATDDDGELDWIERHLTALAASAEALGMVDHSRYGVNAVCEKAAAEIAAIIAHVREQVL